MAFKLTANSIEEELLEDNTSLVNSFSSNGEIADDSSKIIFSRNVADENSSMEERVISEVVPVVEMSVLRVTFQALYPISQMSQI